LSHRFRQSGLEQRNLDQREGDDGAEQVVVRAADELAA